MKTSKSANYALLVINPHFAISEVANRLNFRFGISFKRQKKERLKKQCCDEKLYAN